MDAEGVWRFEADAEAVKQWSGEAAKQLVNSSNYEYDCILALPIIWVKREWWSKSDLVIIS